MKNGKKLSLKAILNSPLFAVSAVLFVYFLFHQLGNGCPIKYITGVSCPGCGMTRAYLSLFHGDFTRAFYYHPLFFTVPILAFLLLSKKCGEKLKKIGFTIIIILYLAVFLLRLFVFKNDIVAVNFPEVLKDLGVIINYLGVKL